MSFKSPFIPMNSRGKAALSRAYNFENRRLGYVLSPAAFLNGRAQRTPLVTNSDTSVTPDETIDYVIVGAGITGAYLARRLSVSFPDKKILVLEKEAHIGGRLHSNTEANNAQATFAAEFGGMRLFPSIHPRVAHLLNLLGLTTMEVPYVSDTGVHYGRSHVFNNNNLFPTTDNVYFVDDNEKGKDVNTLITDNIENIINAYKPSFTNNFDLSTRRDLFQSSLSMRDFKETVVNGTNKISNENWIRFCEISGYPGLFNSPMSFVCGAAELLSLSNQNSSQHCVVNGYQQAPQQLLQTFSATSYNEIVDKNMGSNRNILYSASLSKFEINQDKTVRLQLADESNNIYQIDTKNLYICTPANSISTILGFPTNFTEQIHNQLVPLPLFKIFLYYDTNWWTSLGISSGRSTTDLNINQLWFYSNNLLLTYAIGDNATYWANKLPYAQQMNFIDVNSSNLGALIAELITNYSKMFPTAGVIPTPTKFAWAYWNNGCSVWSAFDLNNFDKTPKTDIQRELLYPLPQNDNVCYLNNDISLNQGWVEGSIELVDDFLSEKFNMPNILSATL